MFTFFNLLLHVGNHKFFLVVCFSDSPFFCRYCTVLLRHEHSGGQELKYFGFSRSFPNDDFETRAEAKTKKKGRNIEKYPQCTIELETHPNTCNIRHLLLTKRRLIFKSSVCCLSRDEIRLALKHKHYKN